ncbi:MAG: hypothetical protein HY717_01640 [Planctomycetes bacterium]|nr:hypothetical protein [Planctomycetota bacterium]
MERNKQLDNETLGCFIGFFPLLSLVGWGISMWRADAAFEENCGGHLERAANASTIEIAATELQIAVLYLEKNNITSGKTSVFFTLTGDDVGYWYKNLKAALGELQAMELRPARLEDSNVLINLRQILLKSGGFGGERIVVPEGISVFPNNKKYAWWAIISLAIIVIALMHF